MRNHSTVQLAEDVERLATLGHDEHEIAAQLGLKPSKVRDIRSETVALIRDVAAVVVGGQHLPLPEPWQRLDALAAMTALGFSRDHVVWALRVRSSSVTKIARRAGVRLNPHDQRPDPHAVAWVCQGTRLNLSHTDRDEVIRRLGGTHSATEIGELTGWSKDQISTRASELGVSTSLKSRWTYSGYPTRQRQPQAA